MKIAFPNRKFVGSAGDEYSNATNLLLVKTISQSKSTVADGLGRMLE